MIRLLVVEDDPFTRVFIRQVLKNHPNIEIVGEAATGQAALEMLEAVQPDIVSMDIMMPGMDGLETTRRMLAKRALPIIMVSELTQEDSLHTLRAMEMGAADYLCKSSDHLQFDIPHLSKNLPGKIKYWAENFRNREKRTPAVKTGYQLNRVVEPRQVELVVVGVSSGGPQVLPEILKAMGKPTWPVVVAQQMPAIFSKAMAAQLEQNTGMTVVLGSDQLPLEAGTLYLAPGGVDAVLQRNNRGSFSLKVGLLPDTVVHPCASALLESAANLARSAVGVILSGVGDNGCRGAKAMAAKGWPVLVQKPETCMVDEMALATLYAGSGSAVMTPQEIGQQLAKWR